jgi:hypothetical protein
MHPLSAPLVGGDWATLQTACLTKLVGRWCTATRSVFMTTHALPRKQPREANATSTTDITTLGEGPDVAGVSYFPPFCPWARMSGLSTLVRAPLSYKRGGMQRYNTDPSHRRLKLTSNTTHSGVGYYAPVARTTLNPCVFLCVHPPNL